MLGVVVLSGCSTSDTRNVDFEIEKYKSICRVWGVLKYFHPEVGTGLLNWDKNLLEVLEKADTIKNKKQLNQLIELLIQECKSCEKNINDSIFLSGEFNFKREFPWLKDTTYISQNNLTFLDSLIKNKKSYLNYYVSQNYDIGNLSFSNERSYADSVFPSKNLRLLSLFRYWNIIYYFHPYLEINDVSWDFILNEYIPEFIQVDNTLEYHLKVLEFTSQLNDGHIWTESIQIALHWGILSPPYRVTNIENTPVVNKIFPDSIGKLYNVLLGDIILAVNNVPVEEIFKNRSKYYSFSNTDQFNRRIYDELLITSNQDSIILDIKRGEDIFRETIPTYYLYDLYELLEIEEKNEIAFLVINDSIGYINLEYLEIPEINGMMNKFLKLEKLIVDIRNYPNGVLYELSKYLNPNPTEFVKIFTPNVVHPGEFIWWEFPLSTGIDNIQYYKGQIVLLVNESTQSHAEFTTMCLQSAPNVTTIGSMTAGTDGNVSMIVLPGGIDTYFTGIGIEYPDGTPTQRVGIKIDTIIKPQIEDLEKGIDRLLEYAIQL